MRNRFSKAVCALALVFLAACAPAVLLPLFRFRPPAPRSRKRPIPSLPHRLRDRCVSTI